MEKRSFFLCFVKQETHPVVPDPKILPVFQHLEYKRHGKNWEVMTAEILSLMYHTGLDIFSLLELHILETDYSEIPP